MNDQKTDAGNANPVPPYKLTLANKITIVRILGIPVFILLMVYYLMGLNAGEGNEYYRVAALIVFGLIALTDALDGYVARSRGEVTRLGKILDPLADKALLMSAVVLLTRPSLDVLTPQFPVSFTLVFISRDVMLILGAFIIHHFAGTVHVHPRLAGKATTLLLMISVVYALLSGPERPFLIMACLTGVLVVVSGLQYLVDGIRQIEAVPHHD